MDLQLTIQTFFQELVILIIQLFVPIVAAFIVGLLYQWLQILRAKLGNERSQMLEMAVAWAVQAAEQSGLKNDILKSGTAKKDWAVSEVQRILNEKGYKNVSANTIATVIESSILLGIHKKIEEIEIEMLGYDESILN